MNNNDFDLYLKSKYKYLKLKHKLHGGSKIGDMMQKIKDYFTRSNKVQDLYVPENTSEDTIKTYKITERLRQKNQLFDNINKSTDTTVDLVELRKLIDLFIKEIEVFDTNYTSTLNEEIFDKVDGLPLTDEKKDILLKILFGAGMWMLKNRRRSSQTKRIYVRGKQSIDTNIREGKSPSMGYFDPKDLESLASLKLDNQ